MIKLFGPSQIIKHNEILSVIHYGDELGQDVVYQNGKPIQITMEGLTVRAHVQPVQVFQLLLVPEGDRFKEQYYLYFNNLCFVTDQGIEVQSEMRLQPNDKVCRLGVNYTVQEVENWGTFCRARVMRIDVGPNSTPNP